MELDARQWPEPKEITGDVCIIGGGPSGLSLASALIPSGQSIVVLESGTWTSERAVQRLNNGPTVGWTYSGLGITRHRRIGGTAHHWNSWFEGRPWARYAPLDPVDFERPGWPFGFGTLEPWYREAQALCRLGPFRYDAESWSTPGLPAIRAPMRALTSRVYQYGPAEVFTAELPRRLLAAPNVILCHSGTVCKLHAEPGRGRLAGVEVRTLGGKTLRVAAGSFVLAAGAVENARLLLIGGGGGGGFGDHSSWVGRCFMEHPRDRSIRLRPASGEPTSLEFYEMHRSFDGAVLSGRLALDSDALRRESLPNASATLLPASSWGPLPRGFERLGLTPRRRLRAGRDVQILLNLEHLPHPANRIVLGREVDQLGLPRAELRWAWRPEEQEALERLRTLVARDLETLGPVQVARENPPDPNAHHHAGTTRMHRDAAHGVVDPDGRVHDMDNLFVTGSSVLPSAGFVNPVLTIVALALRLADHLIRR